MKKGGTPEKGERRSKRKKNRARTGSKAIAQSAGQLVRETTTKKTEGTLHQGKCGTGEEDKTSSEITQPAYRHNTGGG